MTEKIIYEPHPVTTERKKELRAQGFKIIDAQFDPNPKPAKTEKDDPAADAKKAEEKAAKEAEKKAAAEAKKAAGK